MKNIILFIALTSSTIIFGQVKIGDNHNTIHPDAMLALEATDKGVLFPRVALDSINAYSPLGGFSVGMIVYNTATSGSEANEVTPGLYISNGSSWLRISASAAIIPGAAIGEIITLSHTTIPNGYLYCDGSAVSRTTYADLFGVIGTTYGVGDGSNTFNLPDYRGEFLRAQDDGAGNDPDAGSRTGGDAVGSSQAYATAVPNSPITGSTSTDGDHNHSIIDNSSNNVNHISGGPSNSTRNAVNVTRTSGSAGDHTHTLSVSGGGDAESRPVNIYVRYGIKYTKTSYLAEKGETGPIGNPGVDGTSLLTGNSSPSTQGNNGDMLIDTLAKMLYGVKSGGNWPSSGVPLGSSDIYPTGAVISKASASVPSDYLYCNGQAVSRTTYAKLFNVIGTTYGSGDGSTTFNLPDYRGYFLRGQDDGANRDPDASTRTDRGDGTSGDAVGSIQQDEIEGHAHDSGTNGNYTSMYGLYAGATSGVRGKHQGVSTWNAGVATSTVGGNETRPVNINVRYYIKL